METSQGMIGAQTQKNIEVPTKVRYVIYCRKSSESEEKQILSIDSQVKEMLQVAEREELEIIDIRRESHSAKDSGQRPIFAEILKDIRSGRYTGILTWAPDRLSRNAGDLGSLVDLMDQKLLLEIRTYGQRFTNSPNEKFMLMLLCSTAKLENDNKSVNVKRGLRTRCEMGLRPGVAPTGYLNEKRTDRKCHAIIDPVRAPVIKQIFEKVGYEHWSGRKVYHWLKFELNFKSPTSGKNLSLGNIYRILQNSYYSGIFEYPVGSGNWYTGQHKPLITKELFEKVKEQLIRSPIAKETKEFAFTKLFTCGLCGSGITADEKFKKLKNGKILRYVYYGCVRSRDIHCKGGYINEKDLIEELLKIIDIVDVDELGIRGKMKEELHRFNKFQQRVLGIKTKQEPKQIETDVRTYAKYLLKEGAITEKRELLSNLKSKLTYKNKKLELMK